MEMIYVALSEPALSMAFRNGSASRQSHPSMIRLMLLFLLSFSILAAPAATQERRDHERARAALEAGEIRPLAELLAEVERRYQGRVIEADLERDDGYWLYEFKILPSNGRMFVVEIDAATGALLRSRGPVQVRQ